MLSIHVENTKAVQFKGYRDVQYMASASNIVKPN